MVLRKPYAFLIKHFKLIHLIMTVLMLFLVFQTNTLLTFFNNVIASSQIIVGSDVTETLFSNYAYLASIGIILLAAIIFVLMSFKNKPSFYYGLTIVGYILLAILYAYAISTVGTMQKEVVDERIVRAIRDFLNIMFIFQLLTLLISFIRTIGLDIKKFDFKDDLADLGLDELDNEEFEVNINFDSAKMKRKFKSEYRNIKYYFAENKFMLIAVVAIVLIIGLFFLYRGLKDETKSYRMNEAFSPIGYNIIIENAYKTSENYQLNKVVPDDKTLVIIKFKIKALNKDEKFIFGKLALRIDGIKYYHNTKYGDAEADLGNSYIGQDLTDSYQNFILIYEIPSELKNEKMELIYTEQLVSGMLKTKTDDIRIPLSVIDLDLNREPENINIDQNYLVGEGLLKDYSFKLHGAEINKNFKIDYNLCVKSNECYTYYEYLTPTLSGISDKVLLRLNMELTVPDMSDIKNVNNLIARFGYIEYASGDNVSLQKIGKTIDTTHKDGNYYFELKDDVLTSDNISIVIKARNYNYKFKLK